MLTKIFVTLVTIAIAVQGKLYQVVSLTRHGARYHVNPLGDGNDTKPLWGELTAVGMRQHQRLGQLFRQQYIKNLNFLSPNFNKSEIQIYSTPFNRTLSSIQSQFYGLYPPGTGPRLTFVDRKLHIPPYSNKTDIEQQNYAVPNGYQPVKIKLNEKIMLIDCPNFDKFQKQNYQKYKDVVDQMYTTYYPFFKKLSPMFNFTLPSTAMSTFYLMLRVMDVVNVDNYLGRPLPQNFTNNDSDNVFHLANWHYSLAMLNKNSLTFSTGKLQKILSVFDMRTRLPDTYQLKWTFLSGHDTDIFALHLALNLSSPECIQQLYRKKTTSALNCQTGANLFVVNIIFQLHSDDAKTFYVKIRSNGRYMYLCGKKSIQCQYTQFKAQVKKNIATNVQELCGKPINLFQDQAPILIEQYQIQEYL